MILKKEDHDTLRTAGLYLHSAFDKSPQSPECKKVLKAYDALVADLEKYAISAVSQAVFEAGRKQGANAVRDAINKILETE